MPNNNSLVLSAILSVAFASVNGFSQAPSMTPTPELLTVSAPTSQPVRNARGAYFDNFASPGLPLDARDPRSGPAMITHTPSPLKSELPQDLADTIVVGKITGIQAYLSANRKAIYTESTILIEEVISSKQSLTTGNSLVILHDGGAILLGDSNVVKQLVYGSGDELQKNGEYVFFLREAKPLQAYGCSKAWALVNGTVVAVSSDDLARVANHTSTYHGMEVSTFLSIARRLKASLTQP